MALLAGEFKEGDTIRVDYHEDTIVFESVSHLAGEQVVE
jgi:hypothetical protein